MARRGARVVNSAPIARCWFQLTARERYRRLLHDGYGKSWREASDEDRVGHLRGLWRAAVKQQKAQEAA